MSNDRINDARAREVLERAATELLAKGCEELAFDIQQLLLETIDLPVEYGCQCCGGKHSPWTAHCIHCNPGQHLTSKTAEALKACNWTNTPQVNKEVLTRAIQELEAANRTRDFTKDLLAAFISEWNGYLVLDRVGEGSDARFVYPEVELAFVSWCKGGIKLSAALNQLANQRVVVKRLRQEITDLTETAEKGEIELEPSLHQAQQRDTEAFGLLNRILKGTPTVTKGELRTFLKRAESLRAWGGQSMDQTLSNPPME